MPRVLLVKTSSLGDIVHNLPVVTDIHRWVPDTETHWAIEEAFLPLPGLHPGVTRVTPVPLGRWRNLLFHSRWREEIAHTRNTIRSKGYDVVIDMQGLLRSALS